MRRYINTAAKLYPLLVMIFLLLLWDAGVRLYRVPNWVLPGPFQVLEAITRRKMHLWLLDLQRRFPSSVWFVTHDIEEALLIASRILVLSARPAQVRLELDMRQLSGSPEQLFRIKNQILAILEAE